MILEYIVFGYYSRALSLRLAACLSAVKQYLSLVASCKFHCCVLIYSILAMTRPTVSVYRRFRAVVGVGTDAPKGWPARYLPGGKRCVTEAQLRD